MVQRQSANCPRPGITIVADKGFAWDEYEQFLAGPDLDLTLFRPARKNEEDQGPSRTGCASGWRRSSGRSGTSSARNATAGGFLPGYGRASSSASWR